MDQDTTQSAAVPEQPPTFRPRTEDDWEPFRDAIKRYYLDESLPLPRVMQTMREEYGLVAR